LTTTTEKRPRSLLVALALVAVLAAALVPSMARAQTAGIPSVGVSFGDAGPYAVTVTPAADHTYFHPTAMGANGVRHPVILWGNGTGLTPDAYSGLLRHFASHGFIVAAANTTFADTSTEILQGLDELTRMNGEPGSRFHGMVDLDRVGASGHSRGGGGAIQAGADPRVDTVFPLQPFRGDDAAVRGSVFYLSGRLDTTIPPASVLNKYLSVTDRPAVYGELADGNHGVPAGSGGGYRYAATAWARLELMDDARAKIIFFGSDCYLCKPANGWSDFRVNALAQRAPK
jgi:hypothetical protein